MGHVELSHSFETKIEIMRIRYPIIYTQQYIDSEIFVVPCQ